MIIIQTLRTFRLRNKKLLEHMVGVDTFWGVVVGNRYILNSGGKWILPENANPINNTQCCKTKEGSKLYNPWDWNHCCLLPRTLRYLLSAILKQAHTNVGDASRDHRHEKLAPLTLFSTSRSVLYHVNPACGSSPANTRGAEDVDKKKPIEGTLVLSPLDSVKPITLQQPENECLYNL